ncbi:MAG: PAS domain S-box protein [bacterium]
MPDKTDQVLPLDAGVRLLDDDIALVTDRLGRVTWCNDEAERVFGIAGQEMVGLPFSVVCGGLSGTGRIDVEAVLAGRDFAGGVDCVHKSGKRIDLYAFAAAGRDESGAVAGVVFIARDVTGYARAEEALRTSEEKYRRLFEQSNDIVLVTDQAGRIEEANLAAAHLTGYTADELRERTLSDLVPPDGRRAVDLAFAQVRERGATMSVFTVLTRTGKPITLEASTSLIRVDAGQRALLIGRDITERQLAEQRVRESEHKYRRIFEASGDAVMVLTFNFGIKDTNERTCELFGRTRPELLAQSLGDLVAPEDKDWLPLLHERLVRSGQHRSDVRMLGPEGPLGRTPVTVEMTVSLLDLAGGPVVLCVGHDVSERRRAEAALTTSEEQLRSLRDNVPVGLYRTTVDGRFLMVNRAAVRIFGYSSEAELLTTRVTDVYADPAERDVMIRRLHEDGRLADVEVLARRRDGTVFPALLGVEAALGPDGAVLHFDGVIQDITDRRAAQDAVLESEARYRAIFDKAAEGVFLETLDGGILDANDNACRMTGYSREELQSMRVADLVPPETGSLAGVERALKETGEYRAQTFNRRRDGTVFPVEVAISLLQLLSGPAVLALVRDMTEQKRFTDELADREARLSLLVAQVPTVLWTVDRNLVFTSSLGAGLPNLGLKPGQVVGMPLSRYFNSDDPEFPPIAAHRRALSGEPARFEFEWGGETFVTALEPLRDAEGAIVGVVGLATDVTDERRGEAERRAAEERYRLLFESTTDSVAIADVDGRVLDANPACLRNYGYTAEEVRQMNLIDVVAPEARDEAGRAMADLAAGKAVSLTIPMVRNDGSRLIVDTLAFVGTIGGERRIFSFSRDVSARIESEAARRESEERYRSLADSSPDAIYIVDREGAVRYCNAAGAVALGRPGDNLVGQSIRELFPPEIAERQAGNIAKVFETGETVHIEGPSRYGERTVWLATWLVGLRDEAGNVREVLGISRDLTERKQAEDELRETGARYRAIFETTAAATMIIEADTTVSLANRELGRMLGYPGREVVGRSWTEFVVPEDLPRMRSYHDLRRSSDPVTAPRTYEARLVDKQGVIHDCLLTVDMIPGTGRSVASVLDITDRKRVEADLRESDRRLRSLFRTVPAGIYRTTPDGRILMANPALVEMLGFDSLNELLARNIEEGSFGPGESRAAFKAALEAAGELRAYESSWLRADGQIIVVRESARLVRDADGRVACYEGTVEDVTAQKAAERARREGEQNFSALAANSSDGIGITIGKSGRFGYVNQRVSEMTGYSGTELLEMSFLDVVAPECREPMLARLRSRLAGGIEPRTYETTVLRRDGTRVPVELSVSVTTWHGESATVASVRDISERKAAAAALRRSEESYRSALDAMIDPATVVDANLTLLIANRAMRDWLGRLGLEPDIIGKPLRVVFPFLPASVEDEYRRVFATGEPLATTETSEVGGVSQATETTKTPIFEHGGVARVLTVVHDVTEHRAAEQAVRESEVKYRSVVERASDGICIIQEGRLKYLNRRLAEMAGYAQDELVGKRFDEYVHPDDRSIVVDRYRRRLAGEELPTTYAVRFLVRGGVVATVEVNAAVAEFEGAPADIVLVRDVGERERMLGELVAARARYESLVQSLRDGVLTVDTEGRVTWVNDVVIQRSGHTREWWFGRQYLETITSDQHDRLKRLFAAVLRGEEIDSYEVVYPWPDGRTVYIEGTAAAIREGDAITGMVVVNRDISARADTERRLQDSEERYRRLVDLSPDMIAVHQRGLIVYANPVTARALGYASSDELVGRSVIELIYPEDRPTVIARMRQVAESGAPAPPNIERFVAKDGSPVRVEARAAPFLWRGEPATLVVVRNMADAELIAHASGGAAAAGDVLDRAPHGIAAVLNGHIVHANQNFVELFGYASAGELASQPVEELLDPTRRAEAHKDLLAAAQSTEPGFCLVPARNRAGETVELEMAIVGYHGRGFEYSLWFARRPGKAAKKPAAKPRSSGRKAPKTGKRRKP